MKKIVILGFGLEGKSVLKFLKKSPLYKKADISVLDRDPKLRIHPNAPNGVRIITDKNYLRNLKQFDVIFRSPGVPYNLPELQKAIKQGVKVSSGTELFFEHAKKIGCKIIGITGTKGKGTTSTLIYKILKAAEKEVYLAGNIGKPALEILPRLSTSTFVILELSSFQLQGLRHSPDIAVILDMFPDHLDAHKNFKEYIDAKTNIAKWQSINDKIFYFADNKYSQLIAQKSKGEKIPVKFTFSNSPNLASTSNASRGGREWFHKIKPIIKISGEHNLKNAVMAATVAKNLGVPNKIILKTIKNFRGLEHRLEFVRAINKIKFYNDSASTNPQTAAAAIRAFPEQSKILIAGGKDKNLNFSPLAQALKNSNTKLVILFGENKNKIKYQVSGVGCQVKLCKDLKSAVKLAYKFATHLSSLFSYLFIIFSPASASFDMFKDYKDRGVKFKKIVKSLKV